MLPHDPRCSYRKRTLIGLVLLWGRIAPNALRGLCLTFFYFFLAGTAVAAQRVYADMLRAGSGRSSSR